MRITRIIEHLCLVLLFLVLTACSDDPVSPNNTIIGSGVLDNEVRTVAAFHSFNLGAVGDVIVNQGVSQELSITVDDNILPYVTTSVAGGVLSVGIQAGVQVSDYDLTVVLTMVDIQRMSLSGVGSVSAPDTLLLDSLAVALSGVGTALLNVEIGYLNTLVSGVGTVTLGGSVGSQVFSLSGEGTLEAFGLASDTAVVTIDGQGTANVAVAELLDVRIDGVGTVNYKGQPAVNVNITGSGQVVDAN